MDAALGLTVDATQQWTGWCHGEKHERHDTHGSSNGRDADAYFITGKYFDEELQGLADATNLPVRGIAARPCRICPVWCVCVLAAHNAFS
jgi:hypothetical protein